MNKMAAVLLFFIVTTENQSDCSLKRDEDGIKVYTCKNPGARLRSLKAEFIIENFTIDQLEKFLLDVNNYTNWQYNMIESSILKKSSDQEMIYRTVVHAPWPVEDRELIVKFTSSKDALNHTMNIVIASNDFIYPQNTDLVRIPSSYATWHVTAINNDLKIEYALQIDPGGSVPAWLVNIAMADGPHHSFRNLKRVIGR
jgi:hypothetical protein